MQIVCPNCSARYLVDPAAIGRQGRTVQCFRCGHKWMAHVEANDAEADPGDARAEPAMTDTRPVPDFIIRPQNHDEPISLPAIPPERGMPTWLKVTLGLVILVGLIGGVGYALRDTLTGAAPGGPDTPPSGQSANAPPPAAPSTPAPAQPGNPPLKFDGKLESAADGSSAVIAVGDILNTTNADLTPRRIYLFFKDKDRNTIGEKVFDVKPDRIPALGRQPYRQRIDDPPKGTVAVDFAIEPLS
ncbi:MAG: zinc-ribbon domain-containing protein [Alphaproteobacteria bacterium]|nr:zinc-ribbon domain-containing protein [Alphaproteobacteria bacterium]